jgi:CubicO group peptidase (beta-lactamase class C family)
LTKSYAWRVASVLACGLCVAVLTSAPIPAQRGEGADGALSGDRLARIGQMLDRRIAAGEVPGAVTLVAQNGRIVHFETRGVVDIDSKKPLPKDAIFSLASLTKPVTAVAILMLIEEGKVRLADPVSRFIPAFADETVAVTPARTVAASRAVTIRDLLTHTSGIDSPARIPTDSNATLADFIPRFAKQPLEFQPGTHWTYSNTVAFDMLARVVEVASGQTYDRFLRERIFEPLGMNDTAHALTTAQKQRLATRYDVTSSGLQRTVRPDTPMYFGGGWGLNSTALDYYRFAQMLLNKGELDGVRILGRKTVELMMSNQLTLSPPVTEYSDGEGFGLGGYVVLDPVRRGQLGSVGQFGWSGAAATWFTIDPREDLIVILMMQHLPRRLPHDPPRLGRPFMDLVYQSLVN